MSLVWLRERCCAELFDSNGSSAAQGEAHDRLRQHRTFDDCHVFDQRGVPASAVRADADAAPFCGQAAAVSAAKVHDHPLIPRIDTPEAAQQRVSSRRQQLAATHLRQHKMCREMRGIERDAHALACSSALIAAVCRADSLPEAYLQGNPQQSPASAAGADEHADWMLKRAAGRRRVLVGIARASSDGFYSATIDEVLVLPELHRQGLGTRYACQPHSTAAALPSSVTCVSHVSR